jgi:hypothetical protein
MVRSVLRTQYRAMLKCFRLQYTLMVHRLHNSENSHNTECFLTPAYSHATVFRNSRQSHAAYVSQLIYSNGTVFLSSEH